MSADPALQDAPLCVAVQLWLVDVLSSCDAFVRDTRRVPVIDRRQTNIANDIDQAINELGGACIYVVPLLPTRFNVNVPGPYIDRGEIRVRCIENDTLNTALPSVYELVEAVARELTGRTIPDLPISTLFPAEGRPVEQIADDERLIFDVIFEVAGAYPARVDLP